MSTLFPFPSPDFLFVHTVTLQRRTSTTTDARGRSVATYAPEPLNGFLTAANPQTVPDAGGMRERVLAVFLCPLVVSVGMSDAIEGTDSALPSALRGRFKIETVRPNESHQRVLLSRWTEPWANDDATA